MYVLGLWGSMPCCVHTVSKHLYRSIRRGCIFLQEAHCFEPTEAVYYGAPSTNTCALATETTASDARAAANFITLR